MIKINRKYLPSKKFIVALSIAIVVIIIAICLNYWKPSITKYKNNDLTTNNASSSFMEIDSDNDGLPDWKESLYGTNPQKADTDGDGTNDGDEIVQNRDPLKANTASKGQEPNDKIDNAILEQNQKVIQDYENLTDIDKFSRNLMSNIIASTPASGPMDQASVDSLVNTSLKDIPQKQYFGITKAEDLNLESTDSTNLIKNFIAYQKSYLTETQKLIPLVITNYSLIDSYTTNASSSTKSKMLKLTDQYQSIVNNLIKMPVPVAIGYYDINFHLIMINDLEIIIAIDKDIVNSDDKSLGIFSNLSIYDKTFQELFKDLKIIDGILNIKR